MEHPITEDVVGVDIVSLQIFVAAGDKLASLPDLRLVTQHGHAIEVRLCAENPFNGFLPCTGTVEMFKPASETLQSELPQVRYDLGVGPGSAVSVHFDSMISKIIVWAGDRVTAIQKMVYVLRNTVCLGITTNQLFLLRILSHAAFQDPAYTTSFIETHLPSLLIPVTMDYASGSMMLAAMLGNDVLLSGVVVRSSGAFANVPKGFRNQPKDVNTSERKFISCQLQPLGHENPTELMVTRCHIPDTYDVTELDPKFSLTPEQTKILFNKEGGMLTRRFYNASTTPQRNRLRAKLMGVNISTSPNRSSTRSPDRDAQSAEIRLQLENGQHTFFVSLLASDEFKREICIYSPLTGCTASYVILSALNWAGKFEERWKRGGLGSSGMGANYYITSICLRKQHWNC